MSFQPSTCDPYAVVQDSVYTVTHDLPDLHIRVGDFLIVRPGHEPVLRRVIGPADAFALCEHIVVCYEDEADPAPDWDTPTQTRHLSLVR